MRNESVNKIIERFNNSKVDFSGRYSHVVLFKEFIRRLSILYSTTEKNYPFSFVFWKYSLNRLDEELEELDVLKMVNSHRTSSILDRALIYASLEWEMYKDDFVNEHNKHVLNKLNLFEPVLRIFDRGGSFVSRENQIYEIYNSGFCHFKYAQDHTSVLEDLSDHHLNSFDI